MLDFTDSNAHWAKMQWLADIVFIGRICRNCKRNLNCLCHRSCLRIIRLAAIENVMIAKNRRF